MCVHLLVLNIKNLMFFTLLDAEVSICYFYLLLNSHSSLVESLSVG